VSFGSVRIPQCECDEGFQLDETGQNCDINSTNTEHIEDTPSSGKFEHWL